MNNRIMYHSITEQLIKKMVEERVAQTERFMKIAFRKHFNANIEPLLKQIPQDFRREFRCDEERYYWCDECFLIVKIEQDLKNCTINFRYILDC